MTPDVAPSGRNGRPSTAVLLRCPTCSKDFWVKRSHADKTTYCSKDCMVTGYRSRLLGAGNPNFRNAAQKFCVQCSRHSELSKTIGFAAQRAMADLG